VKAKPVVPRELANTDIEDAIAHYVIEGGTELALRFTEQLESAVRHIAMHPATGSPRYAVELNLPGLRSWPLKKFPYLAFYADCDTHVDVWRLLHWERDIPAWIHQPSMDGID
jgi:toxin ParE1/3/4